MVERVPFGSGCLYRISDGPCTAEIVPWGASIRLLRVPGRDGKAVDVMLGYDTPEEYAAQGGCLGAVVGPYANRISGAKFVLNGKEYPLTANEGKNCLHSGGKGGFHKREWELKALGENSVVCSIDSPDGDLGFPGNLHVEVTYTLKDGALAIDYFAVSDADTAVNLTNHAYFNLAGQDGGRVDDHIITIAASHYTPASAENIPTGEVEEVAGTAWDLRRPVALGEALKHPDLARSKGFDQNFVLDGGGLAAAVFCPRTGITMTMETDREGVQLYTAGGLSERKGKAGAVYGSTHGLCLETQHFPDAVNKPGFPSPILKAGEEFRSRTVYRFSVE